MKQQWSNVLEAIRFDDEGKKDWTVPIDSVGMFEDGTGRIALPNMAEGQMEILTPNDHALGQLASRVGIPVNYARKCFEEGILADQFNYWKNKMVMEDEKDRHWFMRAKGESLRAVLSDKYTTLDNRFVFDALSNNLNKGAIVDVKNLNLDSRYLNLRMVFPDLTHNVGTSIKRDDIMVGIHVTNSEVGSSSLRIDSCLFRLVCENGMIARVGGDSLMQQRHVHLTNSEMENRVADAIAVALRTGDGIIEDFAKTKEVRVSKPMEMLEQLAKNQKYSNKFTDTLKESFHSEPGDTAFELVNAFTHASKSLPMESRLEVETFAGKLMQDAIKNPAKFLK